MKKTHKSIGLALSLTSETLAQVRGAGLATSPVVANGLGSSPVSLDGIITSPDFGIVTTPGVVQDPNPFDGQTTP